ncbi:hypothetical protein PsYK624_145520 [Phanerochaete sordida]|uniref:DUF6533 domain-containing protein n=1 Tax=Phanerochaete sordida TaxID=48140 RepID=A0A9P3GQ64_9APHY|nr:hypothetical protein PsYK624_145520 [Phanerochaete sordida]
MSQPDDSLAQELYDILTGNYVNCAMMCLVVYEFVITFDQEIAVGWRRKFTATSLLLLSTRWLMVLGPIVTFVPVGPTGCTKIYAFIELTFMGAVAVVSIFSALRVYALWQGSRARWPFAFTVLLLGLVPVWTNIYGWTRTSVEYAELPILSTCATWTTVPTGLNNAALSDQKLRHCFGRGRPRADVGQVAESIPRNAPAQARLVRLSCSAARWHGVFPSPACAEHPATRNVLDRSCRRRRIRNRVPAIVASPACAALHAEPAPAWPARRRRDVRCRALLALLRQLPRAVRLPRKHRRAARPQQLALGAHAAHGQRRYALGGRVAARFRRVAWRAQPCVRALGGPGRVEHRQSDDQACRAICIWDTGASLRAQIVEVPVPASEVFGYRSLYVIIS